MSCKLTRLSQGLLIYNWHKSLVFFSMKRVKNLTVYAIQIQPSVSLLSGKKMGQEGDT